MFDKLNPAFIEHVLKKNSWKVDPCLDELLVVEEQRCRDMEKLRQQEEEARLAREQERMRALQRHQEEMERQNRFNFMKSHFPFLEESVLWGELARHNYDIPAAGSALGSIEAQRRAREQEQQKQKENAIREAQLRELELAPLAPESFDELMTECNNWDDVFGFVEKKSAPRGETAKSGGVSEEEREWMVASARTVFPALDAAHIAAVFAKHEWDAARALPDLSAQAAAASTRKLQLMFSAVPHDTVRHVLLRHFPDEAAAVRELHPLASLVSAVQFCDGSLSSAKSELQDARSRQAAFIEEMRQIQAQQKSRQAEIDMMPEGESKQFFAGMEEMKRQKEDRYIAERMAQHSADVAKWEAAVAAAQQRLDEARARAHAAEQALVAAGGAQADPNTKAMNSFERLMAERRRAEQAQRATQDQKRQAVIARKMLDRFGEARFNRLQEAIGRAPGGVAAGFSRPDYAAMAARAEAAPPAPLPAAADTQRAAQRASMPPAQAQHAAFSTLPSMGASAAQVRASVPHSLPAGAWAPTHAAPRNGTLLQTHGHTSAAPAAALATFPQPQRPPADSYLSPVFDPRAPPPAATITAINPHALPDLPDFSGSASTRGVGHLPSNPFLH